MRRTLLLLPLVALLAGCTQVAALAPVGGDTLAEVRYVANDVLLDKGIDILVAPVCTGVEDISCEGTTLDGETITVESQGVATVVVKVGSETLYDGPVLDYLEEAAR